MLSAKSKIIVCGLCLCMFPFSTAALSQKSFDAMYAAAARGDVASLRSAMHRGLKIDSTDRAGNTGICVAVRNKDYVAYNSFIQAGARPNPPCLDRIAPSKYKKFVAAANKANPVMRNQYTPPAGRTAADTAMSSGGYIGDRQMRIIERELSTSMENGNAYNLLYLPVSILFSLYP